MEVDVDVDVDASVVDVVVYGPRPRRPYVARDVDAALADYDTDGAAPTVSTVQTPDRILGMTVHSLRLAVQPSLCIRMHTERYGLLEMVWYPTV